jgi:hypothetical protein
VSKRKDNKVALVDFDKLAWMDHSPPGTHVHNWHYQVCLLQHEGQQAEACSPRVLTLCGRVQAQSSVGPWPSWHVKSAQMGHTPLGSVGVEVAQIGSVPCAVHAALCGSRGQPDGAGGTGEGAPLHHPHRCT